MMASSNSAAMENALWSIMEGVVDALNEKTDVDLMFNRIPMEEAMKNERFKAIFERLDPVIKQSIQSIQSIIHHTEKYECLIIDNTILVGLLQEILIFCK